MIIRIRKENFYDYFSCRNQRVRFLSTLTKYFMLFLIQIISIFSFTLISNAEDIYISDYSSGKNNGFDCANARSVEWFNNSNNWDSSEGYIGPGDTVHLCGSFTGKNGSPKLIIQGSGEDNKQINIVFEENAMLAAEYWGSSGAIMASGKNFITIDGGKNGIIKATNNGSSTLGKKYQTFSVGIFATDCQNFEIKNLAICEMYKREQRDTTTTAINGARNNSVSGIEIWGNSSNLNVHDNKIYDCGNGVNVIYPSGQIIDNISIHNNIIYHISHGINIGSAGDNATVNNPKIYGNVIKDGANWLDPYDYFHADAIMVWAEGHGNIINNLMIYNNNISGNWNPGSHMTAHIFLAMSNGRPFLDTKIFNNLLVSDTVSSPSNGYIWAQGGMVNPLIANNTILGGGSGYGIHISGYGEGNIGVNILNNILKDVDIYIDINGNITECNNNFFYGGSQRFKKEKVTYNFSQWKALGLDLNSHESDPIIDELFFPTTLSPAREIGLNLSSEFNFDRVGKERPNVNKWDLGCHQYANSIEAPKNLTIH